MSRPGRARRILICEDSKAYATGLRQFLDRDEEIEVVGVSASGEQALLDVKRLEPDLLTLDMQLPGIDGAEVVEQLMRTAPMPIVIVSAHVGKGSERAAQALAAGALEVLPKDKLRLDRPDDVWAQAMRSRLKRLASVKVRTAVRPPPRRRRSAAKASLAPAQVVGIGASTGGPPALEQILAALPASYPLPVLVVQHMAPGFIEGLVRWLDRKVGPAVRLAREGERAGAGIWVAPDEAHLVLTPAMRFGFDREIKKAHRPSVDVLLESLAAAAGTGALGVVLTGMGRDGGTGAGAIVRAGGQVIAQDEASSVVWGMPRAAQQAGAGTILPLSEIGDALAGLRSQAAT